MLAVDGRLVTAKAPTTPDDQSEGVLAAVARRAASGRAPAPATSSAFAHGTTVATNALLEGRGARTVLVATEGFEDVVELGRQARADLYRLCAAHPAPLVPPERRVGAPERMGAGRRAARARGPGRARRRASPRWSPRRSRSACCTPTATRSTSRRSARRCASGCPDVHVSLSHEVVGTFREYERAATTELDAALSPLLAAYLRRRSRPARADAGLPAPDVMQSSGGLADARAGARARRADRALRPGGRRRRRGLGGARVAASAARCASTWAARRATSA